MLTFTKQGFWTSVVILSIWIGWQIRDRSWIAAAFLFLLPCAVLLGAARNVFRKPATPDVAVEMKALRADVDNLAQRLTVIERTIVPIGTKGTATDPDSNRRGN